MACSKIGGPARGSTTTTSWHIGQELAALARQTGCDPSVNHDTAMALILVAIPVAIILIALGMIIFGGLVLP